jgi:hypothetical protein
LNIPERSLTWVRRTGSAAALAQPDYAHSTLSLTASIELGCGGSGTGTAPLPELPPDRLAAKRSVLLLIIDGLGLDYLRQTSAHGPLADNLLCGVGSVCPATTSAAITSFFTGLAPASHGLLGWFTPFEGRDQVVLPLLARVRNGPGLPPPDIATLYRSAPLAARLTRDCHVVTGRRIAGSAYSRFHAGPAQVHGYRSLSGLFGQLERLVRADGPPRYVHAYWSELDHLAHEHGIGSRRTREHLRQIEAQLGRFLKAIAGTDTLLLVTADHGFIDTAPERSLLLNDHPDLAQRLRLPLAGESRLAFAHAKADQREALGMGLAEFLGDRATVFSGEQFIADGFFGPGEPHPALAQRVGDWVVAMADGWTLRDRLPGEQPFSPIGVHGGLSAAELNVPLALFEA